MGRALLESCDERPGFRVKGVVLRRPPEAPLPGNPAVFLHLDAGLAAAPGAVVLDFAAAAGTAERVREVGTHGHPMVLGTTGLEPEVEAAVRQLAERAAIVVAPNTSPGVALLRRALRGAVGPASFPWEIGILERHHRAKRDAPSGTARLLEADLKSAGRDQVAIVSLRQGGVTGEHSVHLAGEDEEIVLVHRAFSRRVFARGALLAASFASRAQPGRYTMEDVLAA